MRILLIAILAGAALWSGYWLIGARGLEMAYRDWLAARAAEGWVANYSQVTTAGFPNRFDTTIADLELADPDTGVAWTAPFFQILSLSYRPTHVIAVAPERMILASPFERIEIETAEMRGSVVVEPGSDLVLDRSAFVLRDMRLTSSQGWTAHLAEGRFATRQAPLVAEAHEIGFEATGVAPAAPLLRRLDPARVLPEVIDTLKIDATMGFDRPWDRFAIEDARPDITFLELNELRADWGRLALRAAGDLTVDATGIPEGRITVKATNWREMLDIAVAAGLLPEGLKDTAESGLALLAALNGPPETLDVPLEFRNGRVRLGPIPLGDAPRLVLR